MRMRRRPRVLAYGGGLDSFTMLVDSIQRGERPDVAVFCDVADPENQDPGEWPGTYKHIREVAIPLCEREGIEFVWLSSKEFPVRDARSLFAWMEARLQIPVAGPSRICTIIAKVERFEAWLDSRYPDQLVDVWVGFDAAEASRAQNDPNAGTKRKPAAGQARRVNRFPLIERQLCRCRCEVLVRAAGFPVPRKSACVFCPYGTRGDFKLFARTMSEHFARVVRLEELKPPTEAGFKLSLMGFRKIKDKETKQVLRYVAPPLPIFISKSYKPKVIPCKVCGAAQRATKEAGCGYLDDAA